MKIIFIIVFIAWLIAYGGIMYIFGWCARDLNKDNIVFKFVERIFKL